MFPLGVGAVLTSPSGGSNDVMAEDTAFPRLVTLACHDLRTPLATILGFARTIPGIAELDSQAERYLDLIASAAVHLGDVIEELSVAARIEDGRLVLEGEPVPTSELARSAAEALGDKAEARGEPGALVTVDRDRAVHALAELARCAVRYGGVERISLRAADDSVELTPVRHGATAVLAGTELRDFGAAVALRVVEALGGSSDVEGEVLTVRFRSGQERG
jgi:signal transduction histidine kinase